MPSGNVSFTVPIAINVDYDVPVVTRLTSNSKVIAIDEPITYQLRITNPKQFTITVDNFAVDYPNPSPWSSDLIVAFSESSIDIPPGEERTNVLTISADPGLSASDVEVDITVTADAEEAT